ncbi:MAG: fluoride efflux transporter CrcB [Actinomycetota bacterium]
MRTLVAIAVAGAAGTLARYGLDRLVDTRTGGGFPWGTLLVNITGAFALGFLFTLMAERLDVAAWLRTAVTTGFLGAYTTFSTLSFETVRLAESGAVVPAVTNAAGSIVLGVLAAAVGIYAGRLA